MNFKIESFYNPHLASGTDRIDVVLSVTAESSDSIGTPAPVAPPVIGGSGVVGILVDMSGSMQGDREQAAIHAVRRAIALLDERTRFFIIQFSSNSRLVYPLSYATPTNKMAADDTVKRLQAGGGTFMSTALRMARDQFLQAPDSIHYALFLTDGKNDETDTKELAQILALCDGVFQCDCRGVGTDWEPKQLRVIAEKLLGTADIIPNPAAMEADFTRAIQGALARSVNDVRLRIWTPKAAHVVACKQVSPRIEILLGRQNQIDSQTADFPTGAWSNETRDYYVAIQLPPGADGDEMLSCRPSVMVGVKDQEAKYPGGNVVVKWTLDDQLSARIEDHVAHYTGQQELASAIQEGLEARQRGDVDVATRALGKAAKIAHDSGNEETTRRLAKVVEIVDAGEGTVRLKAAVAKADEMDLDLGSTRTARVSRGG